MAEHNPPTAGSANGRIRLRSDNSTRSRQRLHGLAPPKDSIRTLEATTRRRVVRSAGGVSLGSDRSLSRNCEYRSDSSAHSRQAFKWRFNERRSSADTAPSK